MPKDERQESALDRLTRLISCSSQVTILKQVRQYLIDPTHQSMEECQTWIDKEIKRLEAIRDGLG